MKRLFQMIGLICLFSMGAGYISYAAAYTPGQPNGTYTLNYSRNQYANDTVMTDKLGGGWKTDAGYGIWKFYTGYDVGGYVYYDDINYGTAGNHPWLYSVYKCRQRSGHGKYIQRKHPCRVAVRNNGNRAVYRNTKCRKDGHMCLECKLHGIV